MHLRSAVVLVALVSLTAQATDSPTLAQAIDQFQRGAFSDVRTQLERLKTSSALSEPDQLELRMYLGATYHALDEPKRAHEEFFELFKQFPAARVDPELFVPSVVEVAERARLDALGVPQDAPRVATLTPAPGRASPLLFLPFGTGQFLKGERTRGFAFLAAQTALFVAAGVSLAILETSKVESYGLLRGGTFRNVGQAQALNVTVATTFWLGVAVGAWGVLDAVTRAPEGASAEVAK